MTADFSIRPATAADLDAITEIWHAGASLPGVGPPVLAPVAELRARVDLEIAAGWQLTVAVRNGLVLGFLATKPRDAILDQLFVRPGELGAGIGRALLEHAMAAMPNGFTLFTRPSNERALRFYERAGLVHLRDDVHPRFGDPIVYYGWRPRAERG